MQRAVFLDRDGTICEEVGYLDHVDRLAIFPRVGVSLRRLNDSQLKVIVVTNQSGVARGYFPESFLNKIHRELARELARDGARLDAIYYCPHHPEGTVEPYRLDCECRKPKTGLLERAAIEHNLDLTSSFIVGDKYLDMETGFRAGTRTVLVLTGYGNEQYASQSKSWRRQPDYVAEDLSRAVDWILEQVASDAVCNPSQSGETGTP
jgi:D-glycero-D-manno-heptose 1,7-bisphosphate phosphatase